MHAWLRVGPQECLNCDGEHRVASPDFISLYNTAVAGCYRFTADRVNR